MADTSVPLWMQHGGWYRPINDLESLWRGSPELDKPKKSPYGLVIQNATPPRTPLPLQQPPPPLKIARPTAPPIEQPPPSPVRRRRITIARAIHRLADKIARVPEHEALQLVPIPRVRREEKDKRAEDVPLKDWKAWGYYAYPKLHGHYIQNFPPEPDIPPSIDAEEVFQNLKDDDNIIRPERWIRGLQHPALPPRPERWVPHRKQNPLPFPWNCQLNPFLQHITFGRPHLDWDISAPSAECYMGRTDNKVLIPLSPADKAQPATYPFVTHMYINALADDPYPEHFWPFYVVNEHGVTVKDVLDKVYENFQEYLSVVEFQWEGSYHRQNAARVAFEVRWGHTRGQQARRLDVLGTHCMFRGLEPHPNREGWTMFVGLA
ncbi:hypothetical protein H0H81_009148 [Sphagnurus paluster]|uniref:DUF6699 domain-containing protein n=1 Tax=Sphagnurus paluster TaxID=117069 RepID=A0A9P7GPV6_9AGAR|nr:hypothetical protein H0H81_009148 [Sphagnurus paluster]